MFMKHYLLKITITILYISNMINININLYFIIDQDSFCFSEVISMRMLERTAEHIIVNLIVSVISYQI